MKVLRLEPWLPWIRNAVRTLARKDMIAIGVQNGVQKLSPDRLNKSPLKHGKQKQANANCLQLAQHSHGLLAHWFSNCQT